MKIGTNVTNPLARPGDSGFRTCAWCGNRYTKLGLPRHWSKCPKRPRQETPNAQDL